MGSSISACGLGTSGSGDVPQRRRQSKDFARDFDRLATERKHSLSTTTDSSVTSILSNSEQLIPDAFMPKDIQVLSQRRQRQRHHSKNSSTGSSQVSNSSHRGLSYAQVVRANTTVDRCSASANKKLGFGIKTASSSFGYSDDESINPTVVSSRIVDNSGGLSAQELRVKRDSQGCIKCR